MMMNQKPEVNDGDIENFYSHDPSKVTFSNIQIDKLDLINNLNSIKMLAVSDAFETYPDERVDLDQFVKIMRQVLDDTSLVKRQEFVSDLVDLFYRCNKTQGDTIQFEDLTSFLIEHEIDSGKSSSSLQMQYYESDIVDVTTHNNYIDKIFYFQQIDKVILYEQNMKTLRFYDAATMRYDFDINCPGSILALEFLPDKNAISVSLSDRTIIFYDSGAQNFKIMRKIYIPSTQKCLCYIKRKRVLFSAGPDGAIFAWNIDKIFSNEFVEDEAEREKRKEKFDYTKYLAERTPWFVGQIIQCVIDLPNINFLATGTWEDNLIRLWDLRGPSGEGAAITNEKDEKFGVKPRQSHFGSSGTSHDLKKRKTNGPKKSSQNKRSKTTRE